MNLTPEEKALVEKHRSKSVNAKLRTQKAEAARLAQEAKLAEDNKARDEGRVILNEFCKELSELCLKYGVGIGGGEGAEAYVSVRGVYAYQDVDQ